MRTQIAQVITFGRNGTAHTYQGIGWSGPEDGFTWIDGQAASLIVPAPDAPYGFYLELFGWPHLIRPRITGQRLCISVNSKEIGETVISTHMRVAWFVPPLRQ